VRSLLLSQDEQSVAVLRRLLRDLDIQVEHYTDPHGAIADLVRATFDCIIVDTDNAEGAALVLQTVRSLKVNKVRLVIALATAQTAGHLGFGAGAHLLIYKPVSVDRMGLAIRAVRNLIARERRRSKVRVPLNVAATLSRDGRTVAVLVVDLSEGGAAIRCNEPIPSSGIFTLQCRLPDTTQAFLAPAEVVWQADTGQSGIRFLNLSADSRRVLTNWLKTRGSGEQPMSKSVTARG
jgi:FixJ family two-component response regulator